MGSMSTSDAAPLPRLGEVFFDVRSTARSLRISWYADTGVAVLSIWQGGTCTGSFRLPMADLPRMIETLQRGPDGPGQAAGDGYQPQAGGPDPADTGSLHYLADAPPAAYPDPATAWYPGTAAAAGYQQRPATGGYADGRGPVRYPQSSAPAGYQDGPAPAGHQESPARAGYPESPAPGSFPGSPAAGGYLDTPPPPVRGEPATSRYPGPASAGDPENPHPGPLP